MSWHFLQEQEEASWEGTCLDGAPDALLSLIPMQEKSSLLDSATESCRDSRSGMTSGPLKAAPGGAQLMLFPVVSPVRTSAQRVKVEDLPASVQAFGLRCSELLRKWNHVLYSRKTVRTCVPVDSAPSSKALPSWGMTLDGLCWEQGMSTRPIAETECGSWLATPTATANQLSPSMQAKHPGCRAWLPTPTASQYGSTNNGQRKDGSTYRKKGTPSLAQMAVRNSWPTPTAHNAKETNAPSESKRNTPTLAAQVGGKLNPTWVEWLMGWPLGWTDSSAQGMDRFLSWLRLHSRS